MIKRRPRRRSVVRINRKDLRPGIFDIPESVTLEIEKVPKGTTPIVKGRWDLAEFVEFLKAQSADISDIYTYLAQWRKFAADELKQQSVEVGPGLTITFAKGPPEPASAAAFAAEIYRRAQIFEAELRRGIAAEQAALFAIRLQSAIDKFLIVMNGIEVAAARGVRTQAGGRKAGDERRATLGGHNFQRQQVIDKVARTHPGWSLTQVREEAAQQLGISRRTLERHKISPQRK